MSDKTTTEEGTITEGTTDGMAKKLKAAGKMAETQQKQRRERQVKGSHLLGALQERAKGAGLNIEDKSGFLKITGPTKGRTIYVAKKGGRVDLSGFTVQSPAIKQISEEEARDKHLGKVRGQLDFSQPDEAVLEAYDSALAEVSKTPAAE